MPKLLSLWAPMVVRGMQGIVPLLFMRRKLIGKEEVYISMDQRSEYEDD